MSAETLRRCSSHGSLASDTATSTASSADPRSLSSRHLVGGDTGVNGGVVSSRRSSRADFNSLPAGVFPSGGSSNQLLRRHRYYVLEIVNPRRSWILRSEDRDTLEGWFTVLDQVNLPASSE